MYITLKEARKHLQIDDFFTEDDNLILDCIRAAEDATEKRLNRPLAELVDPLTGMLSASVRQAVLMLAGTFYNQREATTLQNHREAALAFTFLTDLDRKGAIG